MNSLTRSCYNGESISDLEMVSVKVMLRELAAVLAMSRISGDDSVALCGVKADHRKLVPGELFICVRGAVHDGHKYAAEAAAKGAAALVVEQELTEIQLPQLIVKDTRQVMGAIASYVYGHPSRALRLIGITGTNGKTTTAF